MRDYSIEIETSNDYVKSIMIGGGYIAQKLSLNLQNRGLASSVVASAKDFDVSSTPEFIFLFINKEEKLPESVLNFAESIKSKLIIISIDSSCSEDMVKQCSGKEANYCFVSIYDVYGGSGEGSALESAFAGLKKKKLISYKNDQIIITPIFVEDVADALCRVAFATQTFKKKFLVTGKDEIPLVGFVQRAGAEATRKFGLLINPEDGAEEYPETLARHEKIMQRDNSYSLLSWQPEVSLDRGIGLALDSIPVEPQALLPEVKKKTILSPENLLRL